MAILPFSDSLKHVIAQSRLTALDLGCDYVSTLHFFLADCQLHPLSSLKGLLFKDEADFQRFYASLREGPAIFATEAGSVPLTVEAEKTLQQAARVCKHYREASMYPCHVFVAANQFSDTVVNSLLTSNNFSSQDALAYYIRLGQLPPPVVKDIANQSLVSRLWQQLRERSA